MCVNFKERILLKKKEKTRIQFNHTSKINLVDPSGQILIIKDSIGIKIMVKKKFNHKTDDFNQLLVNLDQISSSPLNIFTHNMIAILIDISRTSLTSKFSSLNEFKKTNFSC